MAYPAHKPPSGRHVDTADILAAVHDLGERMERRFEKIDQRFEKIDQRFEKIDERMRKTETEIAEVKGRVGLLPTIWQLATLVFAIFGGSLALIWFNMWLK